MIAKDYEKTCQHAERLMMMMMMIVILIKLISQLYFISVFLNISSVKWYVGFVEFTTAILDAQYYVHKICTINVARNVIVHSCK